jgi:hypothetical protein
VGAVFMDGGYEVARELVLRRFRDSMGGLVELPNLDNPEGRTPGTAASQLTARADLRADFGHRPRP